MRRGLTMIELLLALSLLSLITLTAASWTQIAARAVTGPVESARWRAMAETVLQRIAEDLAIGDFDPVEADATGANQNQPRRVSIHDGILEIKTRDHAGGTAPIVGQAKHLYKFDPSKRHLELAVQAESREIVRPLLDDIETFECTPDAKSGRFRVTISSRDKVIVTRTYRLQ